jgi:hypothetical protein
MMPRFCGSTRYGERACNRQQQQSCFHPWMQLHSEFSCKRPKRLELAKTFRCLFTRRAARPDRAAEVERSICCRVPLHQLLALVIHDISPPRTPLMPEGAPRES